MWECVRVCVWVIVLFFIFRSSTCVLKLYVNFQYARLDGWLSWWCPLFFNHYMYAAATAKSLQSCPTLCDPIDCSPPGSSICGIFQARILEWVAISFFNAWKWKVNVKSLSRVRLLATSRTAAHQAGTSKSHPWDLPGKSTRVGCHCKPNFKW